jgi:hypothetical protein
MMMKLVFNLERHNAGPPGQIFLLFMPIIFSMHAALVLVLNNFC